MYGQSDWRYSVKVDANGHSTITRGRMYRLDDPDTWEHYFDGDWSEGAFYDHGWEGYQPMHDGDHTATRAISAVLLANEYGSGIGATDRVDEAIDKVLRRTLGSWHAGYVCVGLDRGADLYVPMWDASDPEHVAVFRREIEAVNNGDVWRCEVEQYWPNVGDFDPTHGGYSNWLAADDVCDEWYGDDKAEAALAQMFPLTEFPAELVLSEAGA